MPWPEAPWDWAIFCVFLAWPPNTAAGRSWWLTASCWFWWACRGLGGMVHRAQGRPAGRPLRPRQFWYLTKGSRLWKFLGVLAVLGPSSGAFY
ncbi:hypothetical protein [Akkermansia sp.]|uniref:hypothetical protein n=1 Tax=Akkermansia sp. TaxID=1872421 RepID=UPI003991655F